MLANAATKSVISLMSNGLKINYQLPKLREEEQSHALLIQGFYLMFNMVLLFCC